jgi:hypothetical protein
VCVCVCVCIGVLDLQVSEVGMRWAKWVHVMSCHVLHVIIISSRSGYTSGRLALSLSLSASLSA